MDTVRTSLAGISITLTVAGVWLYALILRLPYLDQIPVFDADVTTSNMMMWARSWLDEGPWKLRFATTYAPASVETPTLVSRQLYQSWPSGAVIPIYVTARLFDVAVSAALVNWINTVSHGLIALAIAFASYHVCRLNRVGLLASAIIGAATAVPILLPRGLAYAFSQIYCVTTHSLLYMAFFMLLEVVYHRIEDPRERRVVTALQLVVIAFAFFVDWLAYTMYATWFILRVIGGHLGHMPRWTRKQTAALALLPFAAFAVYLLWRLTSPGSMARSKGIAYSLAELFWKVRYRMNMEDSKVSEFWTTFAQMHTHWFSPHVIWLLFGAASAILGLTALSLKLFITPADRRPVFITGGIAILATVPFYAQMLIFYQHTAIHQWAIVKIMFAYALLPFVIVPVLALGLWRLFARRWHPVAQRMFVPLAAAGVALVAFELGSKWDAPYLLGRVEKGVYQMYDEVRTKTTYHDVVLSPVWEATPIGTVVGVTNKVIYRAQSFADADRILSHVCGEFNVVVAFPADSAMRTFDSRSPDQVVLGDRITLLRWKNYPGKAVGCP